MADDTSASAPDDGSDLLIPDDTPEQPKAEEAKPEETKQPEEAKDETTSETPAEGEQPKEEEAKPDEEDQEPDLKEVARRSYAERQRLKAQAQQAISQQYTPQTAEELEQQGFDPRDAQIEALRQRVEANEFASTVADLTANMNMDASTITQEFDIFNDQSPNFDKDFAEKVSREYMRDAQVQFDPSGQYVLSARVPMYDYYKSRYEDRTSGAKQGAVQGQKAAEKMLAASETPSSAAPPPDDAEKDPFLIGFDKGASKY